MNVGTQTKFIVQFMILIMFVSTNAYAKKWMNYPETFSCSTLDCSKPEAILVLIEQLVEVAYDIVEAMPDGNVDKLMVETRTEQCSSVIPLIQEDISLYMNGTYISRSAMLDSFRGTFAGQAVGCGMLVATLNTVNKR